MIRADLPRHRIRNSIKSGDLEDFVLGEGVLELEDVGGGDGSDLPFFQRLHGGGTPGSGPGSVNGSVDLGSPVVGPSSLPLGGVEGGGGAGVRAATVSHGAGLVAGTALPGVGAASPGAVRRGAVGGKGTHGR
jgi:hypothetical protein